MSGQGFETGDGRTEGSGEGPYGDKIVRARLYEGMRGGANAADRGVEVVQRRGFGKRALNFLTKNAKMHVGIGK